MRAWFFVVACLLLALNAFSADGDLDVSFPVTKYTLKNGMVVLLYEDHSAPIVSYHTWFRVGSKHEEPGKTGLAHLFEHMMFKGTKKYGNKQFDLLLQNNGISNNAFTTRDYTGYYEDLPSGKLELVMDIESDRMRNLVIDQAMLDAEREVVKEERRMRLDNSVVGKLYEGIYNAVFKVHPYRWPVIGYMRDLNSLSVEACMDFYNRFYAPNNAVLIIGGDINIEKTKKLVDKYYAHIPASKLEKVSLPQEPEQKRFRKLSIPKEVQAVTVSLNYRGAKGMVEENFALDVLSEVLGGGQSSRLYKALINKHQIASSIYSYYNSSPEEGVFHIIASLKPGVSSKKASRIIEKEIAQIQKNGISERDLQKAINSIQASYVRSLKTISGKTRALALNEVVLGDYKYLFSDLKKYASVKPEEVKKVANKYFSKNQQVLVEVVPKRR
jgi:zinc protease